MRKSIFILMSSVLALPIVEARADWRTPQEAVEVAASVSANRSAAVLDVAYTRVEDGNPVFYVVNRGMDGGFVIVNGWDGSADKIIGYADSGAFDASDVPDGLRILMDGYASQLQTLPTAQKEENRGLRAARANISPMVKVQWGQGAPFNSLISNGYYPAGCGPVAYAQIMSYWKFPKSYKTSTYDWDAMIGDPSKTAQLMKDLGTSFQTRYSSGGSSTTVSKAINKSVTDFGYDGGEYFVRRDNVTWEQWEDLLYGELAAKRPFLMFARQGKEDKYTGHTIDLGGAHLFVIDGYKDGLYHVNWGWSGAGDGYYKLSLESDSWSTNYTASQMAIVNIKPDDGKAETFVPIYADDVQYWQLCPAKMKPYSYFTLHGAFYRTCVDDVKYSTYLRFTDMSSKEVLVFDFPYDYSWYEQDKKTTMTFKAQSLKTGVKYLMEPVYKLEGSEEYVTIGMPEKYRNAIVEVVDLSVDEADMEAEYPQVNLLENSFFRGCGASPRSYEMVKSLLANYPDRIMCIHRNSTDDDVDNYQGLGNWGSPTYFFNRRVTRNPKSDICEKKNMTSRGKVEINNISLDATYSCVTVETTTRFNFSSKGTDYRLAYVLMEDSVEMPKQDGNETVIEKLPNYARGIYPSVDGEKGSVPSDIVGCTDYKHSFSFDLPKYLPTRDRLHLAVILMDAEYNEPINVANIMLPTEESFYGEPKVVKLTEAGTLLAKLGGEASMSDILKIRQLVISGPVNATDLRLIRKMAGREYSAKDGVFAETTGELAKLDMIGARIVANESDNAVLYDGKTAISTLTDDVLPDRLFSGTRISEIYLPASLDVIGDEEFADCKRLRKFVMGYFVESLGEDVFSGCISLTEVYSLASSSPSVGSFGDFDYTSCKLYVEDGFAYRNKWGNYDIYGPDGNYREGEQMPYFVERYSAILDAKVTLDKSKTTAVIGDKVKITAKVKSCKGTSTSVTWKSSDTSVAEVSESGVVTAKKKGVATITATNEGKTASAQCVVTVLETMSDLKVEIELSHSSVKLTSGESLKVVATVTANKDIDKTVEWSSSDSDVASVDANGNITAKSFGSATITAKVKDTETKEQISVVVDEPLTASLEMTQSNINVEVGKIQSLGVVVSTNKALDRSVVWTSSDESVATVDQSGTVTGVKAGQVSITAKMKVVDASASCLVVVTAQAEPLPEPELIEKTVNVFLPGLLNGIIGDDTWIVSSLIVNGQLNVTDMQKIRVMCGRVVRGFDGTFAATNGQLEKLDMRGARIVKDGSANQTVVDFSMYASKMKADFLPSYFFYETFVKEVLLPVTLTEIGVEAFAQCLELEKVVIGSRVTSVGRSAFGGCAKLSTLYCFAAVPPAMTEQYDFDASKCVLYVPRSSMEAYRADAQWGKFDIRAIEDAPEYDAYKDSYTPIAAIRAEGKSVMGIYDLWGRQQSDVKRGMNIIRFSDGTSEKVLVR